MHGWTRWSSRGAPRRVALLLAALLPLLLAAGPAGPVAAAGPTAGPRSGPGAAPESRFVPVAEAPGASARIRLDTDLYRPARTPAPAVLLAHGFGGDKHSVAAQAGRLRDAGYVVLTWSARGFGRSEGRIGLDSLDGEVPDARALVDLLAARPEVQRRGGDPVVGAVGGSYGGALALMLGATDPRVDTVVAAITWNDLADALVPVPTGGGGARVVKSGWMERLFAAGAGQAGGAGGDPCGRFTARFCALYGRLVAGGAPRAEDLRLLQRSSPRSVLGGLRAPTLLLQGLEDSLFGLDQSDATARQLRAAGAPVQVRWFDGGHDGGGVDGTDRVVESWLHARLQGGDARPARDFVTDVPASATSFGERRVAARYPGLGGDPGRGRSVPLAGGATGVTNPPGGRPAAVTGLPGLSATSRVGRTAGELLARSNPPGQAAAFVSAPLTDPLVLEGAARIRLRVAPTTGAAPTALLFAQLSARTGSGSRPLPGGVAPVRVPLTTGGTTVDVALPATAWSFAPGDRVVLTLRTTDAGWSGSTAPASFRVVPAGPLRLPTVAPVAAARTAGLPSVPVLVAIAVVALLALALLVVAAVRGRRRDRAAASPTDAEALPSDAPPLVVHGLAKRFRSGAPVVDDVDFTARAGQVVGLLGENGAGKTTTLRMVAGLVRPTAGGVHLFGAPVAPGAAVLERLGCFIEGPGFLPHLSGRRNLELHWAATGRPLSEAHLEEALAVADLGERVERRVGGYSQGMRQRLAIAQAMLGLPDLLVLDEPTNGLDPPQITALRGVLQRYAAAGRTVLVSSHLLAEVERTCSHVVVMSRGRVVADGPVDAVAGSAEELRIDVTDVPAALAALRALGVEAAEARGDGSIRVRPGERSAQAVVAALVAAEVGVTAVRHGRHLEEAFLELVGAAEVSES